MAMDKVSANTIIKKALRSRMVKGLPFYSHEFHKMVLYGQSNFDVTHTEETYSRSFRKLREMGIIEVKVEKRKKENVYEIINIKE